MFIIRGFVRFIIEAIALVLFRLRIISKDKYEALDKPIFPNLNLTPPKHTVLVLVIIIVITFSIVIWVALTNQ